MFPVFFVVNNQPCISRLPKNLCSDGQAGMPVLLSFHLQKKLPTRFCPPRWAASLSITSGQTTDCRPQTADIRLTIAGDENGERCQFTTHKPLSSPVLVHRSPITSSTDLPVVAGVGDPGAHEKENGEKSLSRLLAHAQPGSPTPATNALPVTWPLSSRFRRKTV